VAKSVEIKTVPPKGATEEAVPPADINKNKTKRTLTKKRTEKAVRTLPSKKITPSGGRNIKQNRLRDSVLITKKSLSNVGGEKRGSKGKGLPLKTSPGS